jgi:hypothetical protein
VDHLQFDAVEVTHTTDSRTHTPHEQTRLASVNEHILHQHTVTHWEKQTAREEPCLSLQAATIGDPLYRAHKHTYGHADAHRHEQRTHETHTHDPHTHDPHTHDPHSHHPHTHESHTHETHKHSPHHNNHHHHQIPTPTPTPPVPNPEQPPNPYLQLNPVNKHSLIPRYTEHGKYGLWFNPPLRMPTEYTRVCAHYFRDRLVSTTNSVTVLLTLALDTPVQFGTSLAWETFQTYPPRAQFEVVGDTVTGMSMYHSQAHAHTHAHTAVDSSHHTFWHTHSRTLFAEPLESNLDDRVSSCVMIFSDAADEGFDFQPSDLQTVMAIATSVHTYNSRNRFNAGGKKLSNRLKQQQESERERARERSRSRSPSSRSRSPSRSPSPGPGSRSLSPTNNLTGSVSPGSPTNAAGESNRSQRLAKKSKHTHANKHSRHGAASGNNLFHKQVGFKGTSAHSSSAHETMRHLTFTDEKGFRQRTDLYLLGVDPVIHTCVFGVTNVGAQTNTPGTNPRSIWHGTLAIVEHITRPRLSTDYHYMLVTDILTTATRNDACAFVVKLHGNEFVALVPTQSKAFQVEYTEIDERRQVFARQLALDTKIEASEMALRLKDRKIQTNIQKQLQRVIDKKMKRANKSEAGWARRYHFSTMLEVQGCWERRRCDRTGMCFFHKIESFEELAKKALAGEAQQMSSRSSKNKKIVANKEQYLQTCQWEVPSAWDGEAAFEANVLKQQMLLQ